MTANLLDGGMIKVEGEEGKFDCPTSATYIIRPTTEILEEEEDKPAVPLSWNSLPEQHPSSSRLLGNDCDPLSDPGDLGTTAESFNWDKLPSSSLPCSSSSMKRDPLSLSKKEFFMEMDSSIQSVVNECIGVLHKDPREYHPFYLRIYKYIFIAQTNRYIANNSESISSKWTKYDKFALAQYKIYLRNPSQFRFDGEHSSYLRYALEKKVILNGTQVTDIRDEEEVAKRFAELESTVDSLKSASPEANFRADLKQRLEFFEQCKDMTYPGDTIKMNALWTRLLSESPAVVVMKPATKKSGNAAGEVVKPTKQASGNNAGEVTAQVTKKRPKRRKQVIVVKPEIHDLDDLEDEGDSDVNEDTDYAPDSDAAISPSKTKNKPKKAKVSLESSKFSDLRGQRVTKELMKSNPELAKKIKERRRERKRQQDRDRKDRLKMSAEDFARQKERDRQKRLRQLAKMSEEELREFRERKRFYNIERRIKEKTISEEEQQKLKTERYMKLQAYLASIPKDELLARRKRYNEQKRLKLQNNPELVKANSAQTLARLKSLTGERLQRAKDSARRGVKKYHAKLKAEDPERYKFMMRSYLVNNYDNLLESQRERTKNETEEEREKRLLGYRINQAKRKTRKQMENEGTWTKEEINQRLEQVAEHVRNQPRPERKSVYKPRVGARKPHLKARTVTFMPLPLPITEDNTKKNDSEEDEPDEGQSRKPRRGRRRGFRNCDPGPITTAILPMSAGLTEQSNLDIQQQLEAEPQEQQQQSDCNPPKRRKGPVNLNHPQESPPILDEEPLPEYIQSANSPLRPVVTNVNSFQFDSVELPEFSPGGPTSPPPSPPSPSGSESCQESGVEEPLTSTDTDIAVDEKKLPELNASQQSCQVKNKKLNPSSSQDVQSTPSSEEDQAESTVTPLETNAPSSSPSSKKSYICDECGNLFTTNNAFQLHKQMIHNPVGINLNCPECGLSIINPGALWLHYSMHHANVAAELPPELKPTRLRKEKPPGTGKNDRGTDQPNVCPECQKSFHQTATLDDHIRRVHKGMGHICDVCGRDQQSAVKLWRHQVQRHGMKDLPIPKGVSAVVCEYCPEIIMRGYAEHVRKFHPEHADRFAYQKVVNQATGEVRWKCTQCPSLFPVERYVTAHIKLKHIGIKCGSESACPECGKVMPSNWKMQRHFKQVHALGDLELKLEAKKHLRINKAKKIGYSANCNLCNVELTSKASIRTHFISDHYELMKDAMLVSLPDFQCEHCQEKFPRKAQLEEHVKAEHLNKEFQCWLCGVVKETREQLTIHEKSHRIKKKESTHICSICKAEFKQDLAALREHVKANHPDNYYPCVSCPNVLYSENDLDVHTKLCLMKDEEKKVSTDPIAAESVKNLMRDDKFRQLRVHCPDCSNVNKLQNLSSHYRITHGLAKEPVTTCEHCGTLCDRRIFFIAHAHVVHGIPLGELIQIEKEGSRKMKHVRPRKNCAKDSSTPKTVKRRIKIKSKRTVGDSSEDGEGDVEDKNGATGNNSDAVTKGSKSPSGVKRKSSRLRSRKMNQIHKEDETSRLPEVERDKRLVIKLVRLTEADINKHCFQ